MIELGEQSVKAHTLIESNVITNSTTIADINTAFDNAVDTLNNACSDVEGNASAIENLLP